MRRAADCIVPASLVQAQLAVDRQPSLTGIDVILPVVLPPANRTQLQHAGSIQRLAAAARAAKPSLRSYLHIRLDGKKRIEDYAKWVYPKNGFNPSIFGSAACNVAHRLPDRQMKMKFDYDPKRGYRF